MEQTITRQDVLTAIDEGRVCDIMVCTCDRKRGTGGELVTFPNAVKHISQQLSGVGKKQMDDIRKTTNPNHHDHFTRNMYLMTTREIKKVHIRLITMFNGKRVI